jgi:hypothetical protein
MENVMGQVREGGGGGGRIEVVIGMFVKCLRSKKKKEKLAAILVYNITTNRIELNCVPHTSTHTYTGKTTWPNGDEFQGMYANGIKCCMHAIK